ncbi:MAG: hypothetical protein WC725_04305 [Patescibacteria group bacterium]|jgi:hypothetical protein
MTIENIVKKLVSWKKITRNQKAIFLSTLFLFIFGLFFAVLPASAQTNTFVGNSFFDALLISMSRVMMVVAQTCLQLLMFVLTFIIQIAAYNNYLDSTAVNTGWILIRDLTNMVFVVALLAIAFGTILGIEHYEWKHMLFKLVSAAILVNFSRIICGILIDISQVVMMTFLNGIAATMGGNLIRTFSLEKIQSFRPGVSGALIDPATVFITAMAAVFISVTILVVMGIMLGMLVGRMIVLWVLIVLSPVAFVLGVLHQTEHYASEWWGEFGKNVITGPVLIFFIWLTLVTVGSGVMDQEMNNATTGVPKPETINVGIADVLSGGKLVNFAIAIGMLLVGLRVTQHLGGIGAEWTGKAVSIGKKAAMAVSGVALARDMAKSAGGAVRDYGQQSYKNLVSAPKALASMGLSKIKMTRDNIAQGFEKGGKKMIELKSLRDRKIISEKEYQARVKGDEVALGQVYNEKAFSQSREEGDKYRAQLEAENKLLKPADRLSKSQIALKVMQRQQEVIANVQREKEKALADSPKKGGVFQSTAAGRVAGSVLGSIFQSQSRATSRAENWAQAAESLKVRAGNEESTSATLGGQVKLKQGVLEHASVERGKAKSQQKKDEEAQALIATEDETFHELEEGARKAKAAGTVAQAYVSGHEALAQQKADQKAGVYRAKTKQEIEEGLARARDNSGVALEREKLISEPLMVRGNKIDYIDHTPESLKLAESHIDSLVSDEGEREKLKQKAEAMHMEASRKREEAIGVQRKEAVAAQETAAGAKAKEQLAKEGDYRLREQRITGFTAEMNQIQDKLTAERQNELLTSIRNLLESEVGLTRQQQIASFQAGNKMQEDRTGGIKEREALAARRELMASADSRRELRETEQQKAQNKQQEERLSGIGEREAGRAKRDLLATTGGQNEQAKIYRTRGQEELDKSLAEDPQIMMQAREKAAIYRRNGDPLRAEATLKSASAQVDKKYSELFSGLTYDDRMAQEKILLRRIAVESAPGGDRRRLETAQAMRAALTRLNTASDASSARDGRQAAASELGVTQIDDTNSFMVELQRLTGNRSNNINILKAAFEARFRGDRVQKQAALRGLFEAYKKAAERGDETALGFIKKDLVGASGSETLNFEWAADQTDANKYATTYGTFFAERAKGQVDTIAPMSGKTKQSASGEWVMNGQTTQGRKSIVAFHKGKDGREMSQKDMTPVYASWNSAEVNGANVAEYVQTMQEIKNAMPDDGWRKFEENVKDLKAKMAAFGGTWPP